MFRQSKKDNSEELSEEIPEFIPETGIVYGVDSKTRNLSRFQIFQKQTAVIGRDVIFCNRLKECRKPVICSVI